MALAVIATLFAPGIGNAGLLVTALAIGVGLGVWGARAVQMTDMPQMVALLNGLGGGAAALVSTAEFWRAGHELFAKAHASPPELFGGVIGSISFSGSIVAFGKLQGIVKDTAIPRLAQRALNLALFALVALASGILLSGGAFAWFVILLGARPGVFMADRRRRHACRDLAVELVHGPPRPRPLRAAQSHADHAARWSARRARCSRS